MKIILFTIAVLCSNCVFSQPTKSDIVSMFPLNGDNGKKTVSLSSLSQSQQDSLADRTNQDLSGLLTVLVADQYLDEIINIDPETGFKAKPIDLAASADGFALLGSRKESENRETFLFGNSHGVMATLMRWNYKADGASIVVVDKYLNRTISNIEGTLSFVTNADSTKTLWKFSGGNESVFYEVIVIDKTAKNSSHKSVKDAEKEITQLLLRYQVGSQ
jgi:hypothetical protein